ncbi:hypothetical protein [Facklamia sp. 7083-14-GEN3]|uniref:hypothetical protein n=1 Tax=Facklamia sp. 7083-14-GEN3 TaxID=2973478 RepID=UPI00215C5A64|nr:hypothetical protein [Facklamia sp. 7083-14-GEN3]MCR8969305.1 hypothetical protein [Facklamia sp. 7083-14-GEN3]
MNYLDNNSFMNLIEALIDIRAKAILKDSETYGEAIKKAKSHRLGYKYGELGSVIDEEINKKIIELSMNQSINSIPNIEKKKNDLKQIFENTKEITYEIQ